jgi:hypothetical protein
MPVDGFDSSVDLSDVELGLILYVPRVFQSVANS